jgi:hypothetical protein
MLKYEELSQERKEKELCRWQETSEFCPDFTIDKEKELLELVGISVNKIYFSGFHSQGDGACFTGYYRYRKGWKKALQEQFKHNIIPEETLALGQALQDIQKKYFYTLAINLKHSGNYYHENCIYFTIGDIWDRYLTFSRAEEEDIAQPFKEYMQYIYSSLEEEYTYQQSEQSFAEYCECNDIEFEEEGEK